MSRFKRKNGTNGNGRDKSIYDPDYHPNQVICLGKKGRLKAQIAAAFNISKRKLDNWIRQYPELREAYEQAESHAEAWWIDQVMEGLLIPKSLSFNSGAFIYVMGNSFGWKNERYEKRDVQQTDKRQLDINVDFSKLSVQDLQRVRELKPSQRKKILKVAANDNN